MNNFQESLAYGRKGERLIERYMIEKRGCSVLPIYEIPGVEYKGPRLLSPEKELIVPDLLVFRGAQVAWIEAKTKTVFSWHRITRRWVTGIDVHHYEHYQKIQEMHTHPVWLLFLHTESETEEGSGKSPTGLYGGDIKNLKECENHRHKNWGKCGMVYWAEHSLRKLAELDELIPFAHD